MVDTLEDLLTNLISILTKNSTAYMGRTCLIINYLSRPQLLVDSNGLAILKRAFIIIATKEYALGSISRRR